MNREIPKWPAYAMLSGAAILWGSNHVMARDLHDTVPLISVSFWRWFLALLLIAPVAAPYLKRDWPVLKAHLGILAVLGFVGIFCFSYVIYLAAYNTKAINVGLLNATVPIWVLMIAALVLGERTRPGQWAGVAVSLVGVVVIIVKGKPALLTGLQFGPGDLWALASAIVWAVYSILLKKSPAQANFFSTIFVIIAMGVLMQTPVFLYAQWVLGEPLISYQDDIWVDTAKIAYIAFGPAFLGYLFWNKGVAVVGATSAGVFLYLIPVASSIMAVLFLNENFRLFHLIGVVLIIAGIYLTTRFAR